MCVLFVLFSHLVSNTGQVTEVVVASSTSGFNTFDMIDSADQYNTLASPGLHLMLCSLILLLIWNWWWALYLLTHHQLRVWVFLIWSIVMTGMILWLLQVYNFTFRLRNFYHRLLCRIKTYNQAYRSYDKFFSLLICKKQCTYLANKVGHAVYFKLIYTASYKFIHHRFVLFLFGSLG